MNVKQTVQDAADALGEQMHERKADMKFDARLKAIERNLGQVDNRIDALGKRFPRRQGSRFPLGLVVLAGVGYALYNPSTRSKVLELIGNVSPAARDSVEGMIGKTGDAVADMQGGRDMGSTVKDTAQTAVQKAKDVTQDVGNDVQRGVDRLSDKAQATAANVKQDLKS
ncbi:hypothetical protein MF271_03710 [Deinococcus sp. KNUC1210]|uniref:hypothetical protein n=1 Tax=Deinococcus sp. KNUC1210 TaxID=2917691 RepID=UPI001EEFD6F0|nr:hypothetical protein [Deinococcus sp. KNUC1210]ULH15755.1 hypothetical protein MF271_03710 [Deinococcus sp. KNUC1210]